jgi:hypothetical protein
MRPCIFMVKNHQVDILYRVVHKWRHRRGLHVGSGGLRPPEQAVGGWCGKGGASPRRAEAAASAAGALDVAAAEEGTATEAALVPAAPAAPVSVDAKAIQTPLSIEHLNTESIFLYTKRFLNDFNAQGCAPAPAPAGRSTQQLVSRLRAAAGAAHASARIRSRRDCDLARAGMPAFMCNLKFTG